MSKDISSVADYFPHPEVEEIVSCPTYETLQMLREKLVTNIAAIPSTIGGGAHGHSGLVLTDATYHRETGSHFIIPDFPGAVATVPAGTNAFTERNIRSQHTSDLKCYNLCIAVSNASKKLLIKAIEDVHLEPLKNHITGFANITVRSMLAHLFQTYGRFTSAQLNAARACALEDWDPSVPVQALFNKIKKSADLLEAAEEPLSDKQLVRYAYDTILNLDVSPTP